MAAVEDEQGRLSRCYSVYVHRYNEIFTGTVLLVDDGYLGKGNKRL